MFWRAVANATKVDEIPIGIPIGNGNGNGNGNGHHGKPGTPARASSPSKC